MSELRICCLFNIGPHYDFPLYQLMGEVFHCDFYLGDKLPYQLKTFEYTSLNGFKGKLHNHFIHHFYWQSGVIRQLFAPYRFYIMNGEPFCLSTWLFLLLSKLTNKKVIGWTHGWYGREGIIKGNIKRRFFKLFDKLLVYNDYSINLLKQQGIDKSRLFCFANSLDSDRIKTKSVKTDFAERIYVSDSSDISRYKNLYSKSGKPYENAFIFLKDKINVMRIGLGLELPFDKMCWLMWCTGHEFPISDFDFDISGNYIRSGDSLNALIDLEEAFNPSYKKTKNSKDKEKE